MGPVTTDDITWKIGGEAGFGIMSVGEMFGRICMRAGLHVFSYPEYPSLIRGGHNTVQVTAATVPTTAHRTGIHLLVALNRETLALHVKEVKPRGVVVYDSSDLTFATFKPAQVRRRDIQVLGLPFEALARKGGGQKLMRNTVALGASCALLDIPVGHLTGIIRDTFARKGANVVALNRKILMAGYRAIHPAQSRKFPWSIRPKQHRATQVFLSGNDAIALGALQAGCQFYSAYPMTPSSSILHFLAEHGPAYGMVVRPAEDEIAAINQSIGSAYAGVRSMTATSGGGFSLMTEAVGMAAMTEVGIVIVEAQRGGPSTGLPTWTEQADLRQVLHASQGDFPRIVLAPSSHRECFTLTQEAFHLADRYQTPVIIMTDKYLADGQRNVAVRDLRPRPIERGKIWQGGATRMRQFRRYRTDVADGIAPRTLPGAPGGLFLANSDEHDEYGFSNEESSERRRQMDRRQRKEATLAKRTLPPRSIGPDRAPLTVVTWGSSAGPVDSALQLLKNHHGVDANAIVVTMIAPFPRAAFQAKLKGAQRTVIVEGNQSGQLEGWIRQQTGITFDRHLHRYDGRPFDPLELADQLAAIVKKR